MKEYRHLGLEEREHVALLHAQGLDPAGIVSELGRDKSTISRELRRNRLADGRYVAGSAQRKSRARCERSSIMARDNTLCTFPLERLQEGWSSECIAGWLRAGNEPLHTI